MVEWMNAAGRTAALWGGLFLAGCPSDTDGGRDRGDSGDSSDASDSDDGGLDTDVHTDAETDGDTDDGTPVSPWVALDARCGDDSLAIEGPVPDEAWTTATVRAGAGDQAWQVGTEALRLEGDVGGVALTLVAHGAPLPVAGETFELSLANADGSVSLVGDLACQAIPVGGVGDACREAFRACDAGLQCALGVCVDDGGPTVTAVEARLNPTAGSLGLFVEVSDDETSTVWVELLNAQDDVLTLSSGQPFPPLLLPAVEITPTLVSASGWLPASVPVDDVAAVRVAARDALGRTQGSPMEALVDAPVAYLAFSLCDVTEALGVCPTGQVCGYEDGTPATPARCGEAPVTCPAAWQASTHALTGVGDSVAVGGAVAPVVSARCDEGASRATLVVTAPSDLYRLVYTGDPIVSLHARSSCALPQPRHELACTTGSTVDLILSEVPTFVFVDFVAGSGTGTFTLEAVP